MQAHRIIETWGKLYYKVSLQALVWLIFGINFARRHSANDILLVLIPPYVKFLTLFLFCTLVLTISSISFYTLLIHIFILLVIPQKYLDERFRQSSIAVTDVYIASFCVMTQDWMTVDKICWIWDLRGVLNHKFHRVDDATLLKTLRKGSLSTFSFFTPSQSTSVSDKIQRQATTLCARSWVD